MHEKDIDNPRFLIQKHGYTLIYLLLYFEIQRMSDGFKEGVPMMYKQSVKSQSVRIPFIVSTNEGSPTNTPIPQLCTTDVTNTYQTNFSTALIDPSSNTPITNAGNSQSIGNLKPALFSTTDPTTTNNTALSIYITKFLNVYNHLNSSKLTGGSAIPGGIPQIVSAMNNTQTGIYTYDANGNKTGFNSVSLINSFISNQVALYNFMYDDGTGKNNNSAAYVIKMLIPSCKSS